MAITFKFKKYSSQIFGDIQRPVAQVDFQNPKNRSWLPVTILVDSRADYTLLPKFLASSLGISLSRDCKTMFTQGVGGRSEVYMLNKKIRVRLGEFERNIPIGFTPNNFIPPLLGRQECFETFKVVFEKFTVSFE